MNKVIINFVSVCLMLCFMTLTGGLIYAFFTPMIGERILGLGIFWFISLLSSWIWVYDNYTLN